MGGVFFIRTVEEPATSSRMALARPGVLTGRAQVVIRDSLANPRGAPSRTAAVDWAPHLVLEAVDDHSRVAFVQVDCDGQAETYSLFIVLTATCLGA